MITHDDWKLTLHENSREIFKIPDRLSGLDKSRLFRSSFKFVFVRHPHLRIVSAYQNKVVDIDYYKYAYTKGNITKPYENFPTFY